MRTLLLHLLCAALLVVLFTTPASSTPSFHLVVSFGGIDELAVGQSLTCHAFTPSVHRGPGDSIPLPIPLRWRVVPKECARITAAGLLTALEPGRITVHVEDARKLPKGDLPAGMPGQRSLGLRAPKDLALGRLPQVEGVAILDGFSLGWPREARPEKPQLLVRLTTLDWILWFQCEPPADRPFPWKCTADQEKRRFYENTYWGLSYGALDDDWRKALLDAQVTIRSWKDGIVRGRLTAKTRQKASFDFSFTARLADPHGLLGKAGK